MTLPKSTHYYEAQIEYMDRAIADPKGIRVEFDSQADALMFRQRIHQARALIRKQNGDIFKPGDPLYQTCEYDVLICRIRNDTDGKWWLYLEKNSSLPNLVESLSGEDVLP